MPAFFGGFCPLSGRLGGNAETGLTAAQHARMAADLVARKRTAPLAMFSWGTVGSEDADPLITDYVGMNGAGLSFAPDDQSAENDGLAFRWTNNRFVDPYDVGHPVTPRHVTVTISGSTARYATAELLSNGVRVFVFDADGALVNPQPAGTCTLW